MLPGLCILAYAGRGAIATGQGARTVHAALCTRCRVTTVQTQRVRRGGRDPPQRATPDALQAGPDGGGEGQVVRLDPPEVPPPQHSGAVRAAAPPIAAVGLGHTGSTIEQCEARGAGQGIAPLHVCARSARAAPALRHSQLADPRPAPGQAGPIGIGCPTQSAAISPTVFFSGLSHVNPFIGGLLGGAVSEFVGPGLRHYSARGSNRGRPARRGHGTPPWRAEGTASNRLRATRRSRTRGQSTVQDLDETT